METEHTLGALTDYRITIDEKLLYVRYNYTQLVDEPTGWSENWKDYYVYNKNNSLYFFIINLNKPLVCSA